LGAALIAGVAPSSAAGVRGFGGMPSRPVFHHFHGCGAGAFCRRGSGRDFQFGAGFRQRNTGAFGGYDAAYDGDFAEDHDLWFQVQEKFGPGDLGRPPMPREPEDYTPFDNGPPDASGPYEPDGD
jgi:hypothetical protein